ncbi:sensor histidine kinase [Flavisphingomonas formosensis]|uniref:sensor histidine kinase n=1 Tax=Flavisphingomonas formosensis TaxID=861534 RepID=UPI0012FBA955|nr:HAMP domain-containing sensor histidine kinase [Sphingomonas formosensis]
MRTDSMPAGQTASGYVNRETIHDIRNLFAIVMSARNLLEEEESTDRRRKLLAAIEQAAKRGTILTSRLLEAMHPVKTEAVFDVGRRIEQLEPMLRARIGERADLVLDVALEAMPVSLDPIAFDGMLLELITNAAAALSRRGRIVVHVRCTGPSVWLILADNGRGMGAVELDFARTGEDRCGVHGTGLASVRRRLADAGGSFHVRSAEGRGTVVALSLPLANQGSGTRLELQRSTTDADQPAAELGRDTAGTQSKWLCAAA